MSIFDVNNSTPDNFQTSQPSNLNSNQHFSELHAGAGAKSLNVTADGLFMGADKASEAPFKVGYDGVLNLAGVSFSADSSNNLVIATTTNTFFFDANGHYLGKFFYLGGFYGLELQGGGKIQFTTGAKITDTGSTFSFDRTIEASGDCALTAGNKFQIGSTPGVTFSSGNVGGLFSMNAVGGIITYWQKY